MYTMCCGSIFFFPLFFFFFCMVIYDNEYKARENKNWTKDIIKLNHNICTGSALWTSQASTSYLFSRGCSLISLLDDPDTQVTMKTLGLMRNLLSGREVAGTSSSRSIFSHLLHNFPLNRRQCGLVVRVPDLKSRGPGFKSRSDH